MAFVFVSLPIISSVISTTWARKAAVGLERRPRKDSLDADSTCGPIDVKPEG